MTFTDVSNSDDVIDVRAVIERVEELEEERDDYDPDAEDALAWAVQNSEDAAELGMLLELLSDLEGYGGDHQWRGSWYPVTLVRDSYFREYAMELAEELNSHQNQSWPNNCIDWDQAARELRMDYSSVEFDGVTYWYR